MAQSLQPDVMTMDSNMPHMDGLQATEVIMSTAPRPIVIVSSESREGAEPTLRALELGAIDFVTKPTAGIDLDMTSVREELCRKLKMAAKVRVVRNASRRAAALGVGDERAMVVAASTPASAPAINPAQRTAAPQNSTAFSEAPSSGRTQFPVVVLAASTGGPQTLMQLIPRFPGNFPGSVVLIQHMPGTFTSKFSQQLAEVSALKVKEAEQGELMRHGFLYVCPGSHHLRISPAGRITLDDGPRISGYRPCADLAMETASAFAGILTTGVVLTGMGGDGGAGVRAIKAAGGLCVAEAPETAVIFGMPQEAIATGAIDEVAPLPNIPELIARFANKKM
jgi:two-component system chemotaxis response regulator CheB